MLTSISIILLVLISALVGFIIAVILCADTDVSRETLVSQLSIMYTDGTTADYNTPHYIIATPTTLTIISTDKTEQTTYLTSEIHGIYWKIVK